MSETEVLEMGSGRADSFEYRPLASDSRGRPETAAPPPPPPPPRKSDTITLAEADRRGGDVASAFNGYGTIKTAAIGALCTSIFSQSLLEYIELRDGRALPYEDSDTVSSLKNLLVTSFVFCAVILIMALVLVAPVGGRDARRDTRIKRHYEIANFMILLFSVGVAVTGFLISSLRTNSRTDAEIAAR